MIEAYLDESGIHDGAPVCVIAGYFGGKGQWKKFEPNWKKTLRAYHVPADKFHAKDLVKRAGFFHEWTASRVSDFLAELAHVVEQCPKIHPVSAAICINDFNSFSEVQRRFLTGATLLGGKLATTGCPKKPYFVAFQTCVRCVAEYAPVGGKARFFLGLGRTFSEYAASLYNKIKRHPIDRKSRDRLGDISFPLAKDSPQLQAADLFVYLTYQHAQQRLAANDWNVAPTGLLTTLLGGLISKNDHTINDKRALQESLDQIPKEAWGDLQFVDDDIE